MPNEAFCLPGNTSVQELLERQDDGWLPRGWIDGLTLSNNADDATNDINVAPGCCRSTVNKAHVYNNAYSVLARDQRDIEINDIVIKQLDVLWAPGNGGGRSASSLADGTWHVFGIGGKRCKDRIFIHDSATQSSVLAAMPGGYSAYRMLGSIVRSTSIVQFHQNPGGKFILKTPARVLGSANPGTSAVSMTLANCPTGIKVEADITAYLIAATNGNIVAYLSSLDSDNVAAAVATGAASMTGLPVNAYESFMSKNIWTNTSGQIRTRLSASGATDQLILFTNGWTHPRGRDL